MMLRDYQTAICNQVVKAFAQNRSVMVQMPTGTGKTLVLAALVDRLLAGRGQEQAEVIIVAHRRQLVEQITDMLDRVLGSVPGVSAARKGEIHVYSIQWLSRNLHRVEKEPALVIIDEAHHALAGTYRQLWRCWPGAWFLGLTATPWRMDGEGFTDLFDRLVSSWSIGCFLAAGWLSGYEYYSIRPDSMEQVIVDSLKKRGADGDYQLREMREKLDGIPTLHRLYDSLRKHAAGRKGLVYAIDIAHAEHIAAYYRDRGLEAEAVSAGTPVGERKRLLQGLRKGSLQVLVNVDLFSEGFDCPDIGFIQLARPTLSLAKYLQMVGRGLRIHADKERCILIDNVGLYRVFGLPSDDRDWHRFFAGWKQEKMTGVRLGQPGALCGGMVPTALVEETDEAVVKIASREGGGIPLPQGDDSGFEKVHTDRGTGWCDRRSGLTFDAYPTVVNYGGIELATDDGLTFYPRIKAAWLDRNKGINRKILETQPYRGGLSWLKLFIPFGHPDRVYRLLDVGPAYVRLYEDETGERYVQKDPDHDLLRMSELGNREQWVRDCEAELARDVEERGTYYRHKVMNVGDDIPKELFPAGAVFTVLQGQLCRVTYDGSNGPVECWIDLATGYRYEQRPVLLRRAFLHLLRVGERVYVRNIRQEAGMPYRNWQVRADREICMVGDSCYLASGLDRPPYRIKRRSEDFRMFLLQTNTLLMNGTHVANDLMVMNHPDGSLEVKAVPAR